MATNRSKGETVTRSLSEIGSVLTLDEAAEILQHHPQTVRTMAKAGQLPYAQTKKGARMFFALNDVLNYLKWHNVE